MDGQAITGVVTDIQRMSVHDGPGLRTTVFLKGCNMRCKWCHNPETVRMEPEYLYNEKLCIHCGHCKEGCYTGARVLCGKVMTPAQVVEQAALDKPYYGENGGMTVSGGEPTMQPDFLREILRLGKEAGLHCGIETNLSLPFESYIEPLIPYVDLWMVDLKCFDEDLHKKYTGLSNAHTKQNLHRLDDLGIHVVLRTPVIPGVNDAEEELENIVSFAAGLKNLAYYEALPYHPLGLSKHVEFDGFIERFETPDRHALRERLHEITSRHGVPFRFANIAS